MSGNIYIYLFVMAATTYLIRVLPLTLIRKEIKNKTIRSFLYYVPYVTLAVMTFPAILYATENILSCAIGLAVAVFLALKNRDLIIVAVASCGAVFLTEQLLLLF